MVGNLLTVLGDVAKIKETFQVLSLVLHTFSESSGSITVSYRILSLFVRSEEFVPQQWQTLEVIKAKKLLSYCLLVLDLLKMF